LINRRRQGDLGEASAIEWLTSLGAVVFLPFGHSPDVDLVADFGGDPLRIQVKTSTQVASLEGGSRTAVAIATRGGNQSWNGVSRRFDASRFDFLFVLIGDGRRWFIPSTRSRRKRRLHWAVRSTRSTRSNADEALIRRCMERP
jgi:hypothetical protein